MGRNPARAGLGGNAEALKKYRTETAVSAAE
jgi:hypothetical protein